MRRIASKAIIMVSVFLSLMSCATTSLTSIKNQDYDNLEFKRLLIFASSQDLYFKKTAEAAFLEAFSAKGYTCFQSIELFPPLKQYTNEELNRIYQDNNIDALIVITIMDEYSEKEYVPQSSTTTTSKNIYGNKIYGQSNTQTYGGYYIDKPRIKCSVEVFDIGNGVTVWKATSLTAGNAYADTKVMMQSLASEVSKEYLK